MRRLLCLGLGMLAFSCAHNAEISVKATFGGQSCKDAGVVRIAYGLAGASVIGAQLTCDQAGESAISLGHFPVGNYTLVVTGYDFASEPIFSSSQAVAVSDTSSHTLTIDAVTQTGLATFNWTFGGQSCKDAGIGTVTAYVGGIPFNGTNASSALPCTANGVDASAVRFFAGGNYEVDLFAQGSNNNFYEGRTTVDVKVGGNTQVSFDVPATTPRASANVTWKFAGSRTCADVGVDFITVVYDATPYSSTSPVLAQTACSVGGVIQTGMIAYNVPDGSHPIGIVGFGGGEVKYGTPTPAPATFSAPSQGTFSVDAEYHPIVASPPY